MKEYTDRRLKKADRTIWSAENSLRVEDREAAINRAYYAMFYTAEALLYEKGYSFSKHAGVHSAFGQHFAKTGLLDPKYHAWLLTGFERRVLADYGVDAVFAHEEAQEAIARAREFLETARRFLE